MSKLKTLKDMNGLETLPDHPLHKYWEECVLKSELKQEAIKWYHRSDGNKHRFILEFFNITEEDLK